MPVRYRRTPFAHRGGVSRRKSLWGTETTFDTALASGTAASPLNLLGALEGAGVGVVGGTVVRIHIDLAISSLAADTHPAVQWGVGVFDDSSGMPNPGNDYFADWMALRQLTPGTAQSVIDAPAVGGGAFAPPSMIWGRTYDIKARRRLHQMGDQCWFQFVNQGSQAITYTLFARTLVMLP